MILDSLNNRIENGIQARHEAYAHQVEVFEKDGPRFANPVLRALEKFNHRLNIGYVRALARPNPESQIRLAEQYVHDVNPGLYDIDRAEFDQAVTEAVANFPDSKRS